MRSRWLDELTTVELQDYFKAGGNTAFLPVGAVEMHGPHQPIGTDTMIAKAFSLLLAERTDGIVLPEFAYTWAGATDGFPGTVSTPPETVQQFVTCILERVWRMGFRRIAVISVHGTNRAPLTICVRRIYETHGIVAQFLDPYLALTEEGESLFAGDWAVGKEASLVLAALEILGQGALYSEEGMAYEDSAPPLGIHAKAFRGATGFFYQDLRHHAMPTRFTSRKRGLRFLEMQAEACAPGVCQLDEYSEEARQESNQGWSRRQG